MKEIELVGLDKKVYTEKLNNGLEIYLIPYDNKKNYYISYATRYGSDINCFKANDKEYNPPLGVAHYLEHKMFEEESGLDPFEFFSKTGTDSNASTSYDNTQYICNGNKNFKENLRYLIKFVNKPFFTDENVEKEKGIISEEIKMYRDIPDYKLEMQLRECIYHNSPRRIDIAGTVEEINKITKEDLYSCYNNFYSPNNMFILITGNFNKEEALDVIKEELNEKQNKPSPEIITKTEPTKVNIPFFILEENIDIQKIGMGIKIPREIFKQKDMELELYLEIFSKMIFGPSSSFRERTRNNKLLNDIYTELEVTKDLIVYYLYATSTKADDLINEIKKELIAMKLDKQDFERAKKVLIANEVKVTDNLERMHNSIFDDIVRFRKIFPNRIDMIKKLNFNTLKEIINKIDFENKCIVKMTKKRD